jgi:hypothetical protein
LNAMKKMIAVGSICACLLAHAGSGVALPANEYVCRVQTNSDRVGVVLVQADDAAIASNVASAGKRHTPGWRGRAGQDRGGMSTFPSGAL